MERVKVTQETQCEMMKLMHIDGMVCAKLTGARLICTMATKARTLSRIAQCLLWAADPS